jgi:uncharacterized protein YggE
MRRVSKTASLLALALAAAIHSSPASAHDEPQRRTVTISASGTVKTKPDQVEITTGVTSQAPTAREALDKNTESMAKVVTGLKEGGLESKDIQTSEFSIQPLYQNRKGEGAPFIVGYQVTNTVFLTVRDVGKLGAVLDKITTLGANQIGGITFGVSEPEALKDEARKLAIKEAIENAKLYAEAAGASLGRVFSISEEPGIIRPYAAPRGAMEMAAKDVPIEAGQTAVEVRVTVSFELD